jgi:hypothetical protein
LRNGAIAAGFLVVLLIGALFAGKHYLDHNKRLERLVVQAVSPYIKGSFTVGSVRFGFFSAHLKDVAFLLPAQSLAFQVEDITISISPVKLVTSGFAFGKSINKIVLVGPALEISLAAPDPADPSLKPPSGSVSQSKRPEAAARGRTAAGLAVASLFVRKGQVRLKDKNGALSVVSDGIEGRMWDTKENLNYDLAGRLGTSTKNLFASGRLSWQGEKHRLSLRIKKGPLTRQISLSGAALKSGMLSGALEIMFPDTITPATVESEGMLQLANGRCRIDSVKKPFESVNLFLSLSNTRCTIDSFSARYAGASVRAAGNWDFAGAQTLDRIDLFCRNVWVDSVGLPLPKNLLGRIGGAGWVEARLLRRQGSDAELAVKAGGVTLAGTPLLNLSGAVRLQNKQMSVDSFSLLSPACTFSGSGIIDNSTEPTAYSFQGSGVLDSLALLLPDCRGRVKFSGAVRGVGDEANGWASFQADNLKYSGIAMGSADIEGRARGDSVVFSLRNTNRGAGASGALVIRRIFSKQPFADGTVTAKAQAGSPVLANCPDLDTLSMTARFQGWAESFQTRISADVHSPGVSGGITVRLNRDKDPSVPVTQKPVICTVERRTLAIGGVPAQCSGVARLYPDSIIIDSLILLNRSVTSGSVRLTRPYRIEVISRFDCPIKEVAGIFHGQAFGIEQGTVRGAVLLSGSLEHIIASAQVHLHDAGIGGAGGFATDAAVLVDGERTIVLPFVIRKNGQPVVVMDSMTNHPALRFSGRFDGLDLRAVFGSLLPEGTDLSGAITGSFKSGSAGFPVSMNVTSRKIKLNGWSLDSVSASGTFDTTEVMIRSLRACDGSRTVMTASGFCPYAFFHGEQNDRDSMQLDLAIKGDLIGTLGRNGFPEIGGTGIGTVTLSVAGKGDEWRISKGSCIIPQGTLVLKPYLKDPISKLTCAVTVSDSSLMNVSIGGMIGKRPIRISSSHVIPSGYEPLTIGPFNFGVMQVETPQQGILLHIPGLMEKKEFGDIELAGRLPFRHFTFAGPVEKLNMVGTFLVRNVEFTYPPLEEGREEKVSPKSAASPSTTGAGAETFDLLSAIKWEIDIKPADRKVVYFRDISGAGTRLVRFIEASIDQGSLFRVRGSEADKSLKLTGLVRSYHGTIYYGKTFDRNFEAGAEFIPQKLADAPGYDNLPILWGSVESQSDSGRFDRIKLSALIQDHKSGTLSERGRLRVDKFNVIFHLSSDFEGLPGESERKFYEQAGLQFSALGSAGKAVSDFGEQNLHRIFLQRFERRLAKSIGLDVINIETSFASNYFNMFSSRQNEGMYGGADYLALANTGLTVGRYFFRDNLFIKARGGLLPVDTALTPEYSVGFEFQPMRYLFIEGDYGFYKGDVTMEHNPRVNLQLRLPISSLRSFFDF